MAFCSNCGQRLKDGTKFCPKCGTKTRIPSQQKVPVQQESNYSYSNNYNRNKNGGRWGVVICAIILFIVGTILSNNRDSDYIENYVPTTSEVEEVGYNDGYEFGFAVATEYMEEGFPSTSYSPKFGAPTTSEERKQYQIYEQAYRRGFRDGKRAKFQ